MIGKLIKLIEDSLAWILLQLVLLGDYRVTWEHIRQRKLSDTENVKGIDVENVPQRIEESLIKSMQERHATIMQQRTATHEKIRTLLSISSFAAATLGALSVAQLLELRQAAIPVAFFVACAFLLMHFVAEDKWSFPDPDTGDLTRISKGEVTWNKVEIRDLDTAYQHNENVRGLLTLIYRAARFYFVFGFILSVLILPFARSSRSVPRPESRGFIIQLNVGVLIGSDGMMDGLRESTSNGEANPESSEESGIEIFGKTQDGSSSVSVEHSFCSENISAMCDSGIPRYLRSPVSEQ